MRHSERGMTLIFALIILTVITIVVVYSLEGSSLQSRMIVSSMIKNQVYQECRNEINANTMFYSRNGARDALLEKVGVSEDFDGQVFTNATGVSKPAKSDLSIKWRYIGLAPASSGMSGSTIDTTSSSVRHMFEVDCNSSLRFAIESQTQGTSIDGLSDPSIVN